MTRVYRDITSVLEERLGEFPMLPLDSNGKALVQYENVLFNPPESGNYFRISHRFSSPNNRSFGGGGSVTVAGMFMLDVFGASGVGVADAAELADELMVFFSDGQVLIKNNANVRLKTPYRAAIVEGKTWFFIPITVPWVTRISDTVWNGGN